MNRNILIVVAALIAINLFFSIWQFIEKPRIAYVRSQELVYGYMGMKEMQNEYQNKATMWQANIDTLQADFKKAVQKYNREYKSMPPEMQKAVEQELQSRQNQLEQYTEAVNRNAKEEEDKMLQGVLNQINSLVEEYGRKKGYDMVFGTTASGSILYGVETIDITQELLQELNRSYIGKS